MSSSSALLTTALDAVSTSGSTPDYEDPQDANRDNVYELIVVVIDNDGDRGERAVRVEVMNVEEDGKVKLEPTQPNVEQPATAALTDADGIMTASTSEETIVSWQWYWSATDIDICVDDEGIKGVDATDGDVPGTGQRTGDHYPRT